MVWIFQETGPEGSETAPMVANQASHVLYGYPGSPKVLGRARLGDFWWVCGPKTEILQTNATGQKSKKIEKISKNRFFQKGLKWLLEVPMGVRNHPGGRLGPPEAILDLFGKMIF